jgi:hypothetical protein
MSWSYSGDPSESNKDAVRFFVADTKSEEAFVTDEEVEWCLVQTSNDVYGATAMVARALSAYFSTLADEEIGPLKFKYAERAKNYDRLVSKYEKLVSSHTQLSGISCGGIDISDKLSNRADSSLVQPIFVKGITDYVTTVSSELSE